MLPFIEELRLNQYRNIDTIHLNLEPKPIVLTGDNGSGKTNILEALSYFSPGKGMRGDHLKYLNRQKEGVHFPWAAFLRLNNQGHRSDIGMGQDPESDKEKRLIKIDGFKVSSQKKIGESCECDLDITFYGPTFNRWNG